MSEYSDQNRLDYMLSGLELRQKFEYDIPIHSTADLYLVSDIDDLFRNEKGQEFNNAIILYQYKNDGSTAIGHYTLLKRLDNNNIVHFDSYGTFPDNQLNKISKSYRRQTNQLKRNLSRLLINSKYRYIHYNPHKYQADFKTIINKPNTMRIKHKIGGSNIIKIPVNTCGRHCIVYGKSNVEPEQHFKNMKKLLAMVKNMTGGTNITYDDLVLAMTRE